MSLTPKATYWKIAALAIFLLAAVWLIYGQTLRYGFVNFDDDVYVYQNRLITAGCTREGIGWYFTHTYVDYWFPLLAVSHMADCQAYGLWPGGHHLTNVLLFAGTVFLLFHVLRRLTGALWRSAFVTAAWALHPLRVESVAWVTERKDTLSGLFFLLTLAAYVHFVRAPRSWARYLAVPALFALGTMCKPLVVTLPFVLLLLDYWPLRRTGDGRLADWKPLLAEKIPLFVLSAALGVVTVLSGPQTLLSLQEAPLATRAGNAALSYVIYLGKTFYPVNLAVLYPYPVRIAPWWEIALSLALLAAVTAGAVVRRQTHPWLVVGWFWYLGMLVPMIGIVQAGEQAYADRYTYLPQIGLLVALTWEVWHWCALVRWRRFLLATAAAPVLAGLLVCAGVQASYWRDSETLWRHTLACTSGNNLAQNNLGVALLDRGHRDEALACFQEAVEIQPRHARAQYNLSNALRQAGRTEEAIEHYRKALAVDPAYFDALNNLGIALAIQGQTAEAADAYHRALALRPASAEVHDNLGHLLLDLGQVPEAIDQFQLAVQAQPDQPNSYDGLGSALLLAHRPAEAASNYQKALDDAPNDETGRTGLGNALFLEGHIADAVANWQKALALAPTKVSTLNNLAWVLATGPAALRNGAEAVQKAQLASRLTGGTNPTVLRTLAAAYAEAGDFPEARETAAAALKLATAQSNRGLLIRIERERLRYDAGSALPDDAPPANASATGLKPAP